MNELQKRMGFLRENNFSPKTIIDIGANLGEWAVKVYPIFPDANYLLIDGNPNVEPILEKLCNEAPNVRYRISLLSDEEKTETFYLPKNNPTCTGASIMREKTSHYVDKNIAPLQLQAKTLDNTLSEENIDDIDLLKLDVQGAELKVLKGGLKTLQKTKYCLLEVQFQEWNQDAPYSDEVVHFMRDQGYKLYDIFDRSYVKGCLVSADFLFFNGA
jgi:FkbM family methyltransferase